MLLFFAVTLRLGQRVTRAAPLTRLTLLPVLLVAGTRLAVLVLALGYRRVDPTSPVVDGLVWVIALAVPAMALAFLVGLLQRRLYAGGALEQLSGTAPGALDRDELQAVLAEAVGDPTLQVLYWREIPPAWIDEQGRPFEPPGSRLRTLRHRDPRSRAAGGRAGPRRCPGRPGRLPPGRRRLRADRAGEQAADRPGGVVAARGARLAHPDPGQRRPGAAPDRARPARRRAAAAGGAGHPARADGGSDPPRPRARLREAARAGRRGGADPGGDPGAGTRGVPVAAGRPGAGRGPARRRAEAAGGGHGEPRRGRPLSRRHRERRLLLLPRGHAERLQARARRPRRHGRARANATASCSRSATTAPASTARPPRRGWG